jgi:hypothetical protein
MPVVNAVRRHVCDARMTMHGFVLSEESLAMGARVLDAAEARREDWAVFHRLAPRIRGARDSIGLATPRRQLGSKDEFCRAE